MLELKSSAKIDEHWRKQMTKPAADGEIPIKPHRLSIITPVYVTNVNLVKYLNV